MLTCLLFSVFGRAGMNGVFPSLPFGLSVCLLILFRSSVCGDPSSSTHPKYFLVGPNKAGTTSFHKLCEANHLRSDHNSRWWYWDPNKDEDVKEHFDKFDCFSDGYEGYKFKGDPYDPKQLTFPNLEALYQRFPNAVFFLNTRSLREWLISRYCSRQDGMLYSLTIGYEEWVHNKLITSRVICDWIDRRSHLMHRANQFGREVLKNKSQLVVFDISDTSPLRPFFNRSTTMGHSNRVRMDEWWDGKSCRRVAGPAVDWVLDRCVLPVDRVSRGVVPLLCTCPELPAGPFESEKVDAKFRGRA
eukprot:g24685.t1